MKYLLLFAILAVGCSRSHHDPDVMYGTHKVWMNESSLSYQDSRGFGCGRVDRSDNGYVYTATVINWHGEVDDVDPESDWNSFRDAEAFVEQWCKP